MTPAISIVIASRNRPAGLSRLLACVKAQDFADFECIVADDASGDETLTAYDDLWRKLDPRFRLIASPARAAQGPSATRNRGITAANAPLIAFCDDDDRWVRGDHLSTAVTAMRRYGADLFFANLQTSRDGVVLTGDFYHAIRPFLTRRPLGSALYEVDLAERAAAMRHMFLHCDSLIVSTALLRETGSFWEKLSMAEDRDLALRLLDHARRVIYRDVVVAEYDRTADATICKAYSEDEIRQFVVVAMLHAETAMRNPALRRVARGYRAWMLYELALSAGRDRRTAAARELAMQSLLLRPTAAAIRFLVSHRLETAQPSLIGRPEIH